LIANALVGSSEYDADNPIYGVERDDDRLGAIITGYFPHLFGSENWVGVASVAAYDNDSNIDFYDTRAGMFTLSALLQF
jgi:hypothetical protein